MMMATTRTTRARANVLSTIRDQHVMKNGIRKCSSYYYRTTNFERRRTKMMMMMMTIVSSTTSSSTSDKNNKNKNKNNNNKNKNDFLQSQGLSADTAKDSIQKFANDNNWLPEVVNSRICMVGLSFGCQKEVSEHVSLLDQVPTSVVQLALLVTAILYASTEPFKFNPQNGYTANPKSLEGVKDTPGMLVVEKCNFTPNVELTHGRIAMIAFSVIALIESVSGKPFFGN